MAQYSRCGQMASPAAGGDNLPVDGIADQFDAGSANTCLLTNLGQLEMASWNVLFKADISGEISLEVKTNFSQNTNDQRDLSNDRASGNEDDGKER